MSREQAIESYAGNQHGRGGAVAAQGIGLLGTGDMGIRNANNIGCGHYGRARRGSRS